MAQFDFTGSADPALTQRLAFDIQGLNALQGAAKMNSPQALRSVAQQFEALLLQMMLKSMRDTIPENEYFDGIFTCRV